MSYDPYLDASARGIMIGVAPQLPGTDAWWIQDEKTILLDGRLSTTQQRVMAAHMLAHLSLGHAPVAGPLATTTDRVHRQELFAARMTARNLVPVGLLVRALKASDEAAEVAHTLKVTVAMLAKRMRNLTDREYQTIRAATSRRIVWPEADPFAEKLRCSISASLSDVEHAGAYASAAAS